MTHPVERDWMLGAPWWQWTDPASVATGTPVVPDPQKGRVSKPVFQKYDSPNLVNAFIKEPQRSLRFVDDDLVHTVQRSPAPMVNGVGKLLRFSASRRRNPDATSTLVDQQYVPDGTDTRKIFLDTHKRFYLVVCSVHCDGPGFPRVAREKVCKAGFVIRRRTTTVPSCGADEVKPILRRLSTGRARLARVNQLAEIEELALKDSTGSNGNGKSMAAGVNAAKLESLLKARGSLRALVASERSRFDDWVTRFNVVPQLQGWLPSAKGLDKIGCWAPVDEMPADIGHESSFPLYPLIPDKNDSGHAGQFGTIYFGLLPTSSHDCDSRGRARFDDQEYYEVRCWVLRHTVPHDPDRPCPCPDGVFWSVPTRPYKLASHYDLTGTSHQPVTVQLPNLNELAAQAKPTLGVGFAKPPGSLIFSVNASTGKATDKGASTIPEICFFPIPLITIVAMFVFELFLPIVMFVFQLWWMLALKFCIPPELKVAAGINAEIAVDAGLDIAAAEASINVGDLTTKLQSTFGVTATANLTTTYSPIALANMDFEVSRASDAASTAAPSPALNSDFEVEVTHA